VQVSALYDVICIGCGALPQLNQHAIALEAPSVTLALNAAVVM